MADQSIQSLLQIISAIEEAITKLEIAKNSGNIEEAEKAKEFILQSKDKISIILKNLKNNL